MNLDALDPDQRRAVVADPLPTVVMAGAGSGKTRVLTYRIAYHLETHVAAAAEMMASTFTKAAANEMRERVAALLPGQRPPAVATFHSLMFRLLRDEAALAGRRPLQVCKESERTRILRALLDAPNDEFPITLNVDADVKEIGGWISAAKNTLVHAHDPLVSLTAEENEADTGKGAAARVYPLYEDHLARIGKLDFDDMILHVYDLLSGDDEARRRAQRRWTAFYVDEAQDTNQGQWSVLRLLAPAENAPNLTIVGDTKQCQPAGTTVTLVGRREVPIEQIKEGDMVVSYHLASAYLRRTGRPVTGVAARAYDGPLVGITAHDIHSRYTPEHRCVVRVGDALVGRWLVYLMRKGTSYRVGMVKGTYTSQQGNHGLSMRVIAENADAAWILSSHESPRDARLAEAITSWTYRIPTLIFSFGGGTMTQDDLDQFWGKMGDLTPAARRCLEAHGRLLSEPLCGPGHRIYRRRSQIMAACNVMDGMEVLSLQGALTANGKRTPRNEWTPVAVERTWHTGPVYSLEVEGDETYVADGIVTHNCLYSFRGAMPDLMERFDRMYPGARRIDLVTNYRSTPQVIRAANTLIAGHGHPAQVPSRDSGPQVRVAEFGGDVEQAAEIARFVEAVRSAGHPGGACAVLVRTNGQAAQLERAMVAAKLPYFANGGGFLNRLEVGDLMAYLRAAHGDNEPELLRLRRVINRPTRYLGAAFVEQVGHEMRRQFNAGLDACLVDAVRAVHAYKGKAMTGRQLAEAQKLADLLDQVRWRPPAQAIQHVLDETGYMAWLRANDGMQATTDESTTENIEALLNLADDFDNLATFIAYADGAEKLMAETGDATEICTVHRSKGREWPFVVVSNFHDGSFPHGLAADLAEERRIAYVAWTRARDGLVITVPAEDARGRAVDPSPYLQAAGAPASIDDGDWWGDLLVPWLSRGEMLAGIADIAARLGP